MAGIHFPIVSKGGLSIMARVFDSLKLVWMVLGLCALTGCHSALGPDKPMPRAPSPNAGVIGQPELSSIPAPEPQWQPTPAISSPDPVVVTPDPIVVAPNPTTVSSTPVVTPDPVVIVPTVNNPPSATIPTTAPVLPVVPPPATPSWPSDWTNAWVPLESWCAFNRFERPRQAGSGNNASFQFHAGSRQVLLKVGTRMAMVDGAQCWLGYGPQSIKGIPYVHSSDALKTLQALTADSQVRFRRGPTIVVDAGHGGKDCGASCAINRECEKSYALDWALRVGALLQARGWNVIYTRTADVDVPLPERVALSDRAQADLFLSLHFNSGVRNAALAGLETYCLTPQGQTSHLIREFEDDPSQSFPNNAYDASNVQLAFALHRAVLIETGAIDRGVRRARFMAVLRGQNRPAVLIEGGYLTNPQEARQIAMPAYRQKLAEAVAGALLGLELPVTSSP